jgi:hypothetical protein
MDRESFEAIKTGLEKELRGIAGVERLLDLIAKVDIEIKKLAEAEGSASGPKARQISPEGRARNIAATKLRWAKNRLAKNPTSRKLKRELLEAEDALAAAKAAKNK